MNNRELLELAAKAAGLDATSGRYDFQLGLEVSYPHNAPFYWNPLLDGGQALQLAVKLELEIRRDTTAAVTVAGNGVWQEIENGDDPYAATCRAIVLAAAEVGG